MSQQTNIYTSISRTLTVMAKKVWQFLSDACGVKE